MLRCGACRTKNRIPSDKIGLTAKCGKCGGAIETNALLEDKPIVITDGDFESRVIRSPLPVLLDCWAPWCGPCQMIGPIVQELAVQWKGKARLCKLNVDENPQVAAQYKIMSIPTLLIFDNGQLKETITGAAPKNQIEGKMAAYI
jgi:thioredoxin 2